MPERVVTSPVGDEVLVFDDVSYCDLAGIPAGQGGKARTLALRFDGDRRALLADLWRRGAVEDRSGLAYRRLGERAGVAGRHRDSIANMMRAPIVVAGLEVRGNIRRTHSLRLVALPDRWHRSFSAGVTEPASVVDDEPRNGDGRSPEALVGDHGPVVEGVAEEVVLPPATAEVPLSPLAGLQPVEIELASAVATALLSQVIDIVATGDQSAPRLSQLALDVKALEERLGTSTAYVDKLRRQLRDTGDELAAVKHERDGLRQRLRATEHNLKVAVGADAQRLIDIEVRKQVDRFMREAPAGEHSKTSAS